MAQVMKNGGKFLNVQGQPTSNFMKSPVHSNITTRQAPHSAPSNNEPNAKPILRAGMSRAGKPFTEEIFESEAETGPTEEEIRISATEAERKRLFAQYEEEARQIRDDAINEANAYLREAEDRGNAFIAEAEAECERLKVETTELAYKEGYEAGYSEGEGKGHDEGYNKGLRKCKDTLKELMSALEETTRVKDEAFAAHERDLFDAIFTIANKITLDSLKQKDKAVLQKMLREAAKSFRSSEYIKVSLSKLDIEEQGSAELDVLREIFRENQHIEFEILKDAPSGTLTLDNGSEIIDAGVATQLKMIENLGKGKFRDRQEESE